MFKRTHHQRILGILHSLDAQWLLENRIWFGGGTAIALRFHEYRESLDIDFLCSDADGWRALRQKMLWAKDISSITQQPLTCVREPRTDHYATRTAIQIDDTVIKFEIVREARIQLEGEMDKVTGVPTLSNTCLFAEKLLANTDRGQDKATRSRDMIDLLVMAHYENGIPSDAWIQARQAYGDAVDRAFEASIDMISDHAWLERCTQDMHMDTRYIDVIQHEVRLWSMDRERTGVGDMQDARPGDYWLEP